MLSGEPAFGRGHMKTSYTLNPQPNPGVHYNGGKSFWGKTSGKTTKLWEMFLRQPRDHFIFFWLVSAIRLGIVRGRENQITHKVSFLEYLSFVCGNKWLRCLLVSLSLPFPLDPLKLCDRCTRRDFLVTVALRHRPAIKRPRTLTPSYCSRSNDI